MSLHMVGYGVIYFPMSHKAFRAWKHRMGFSLRGVADALGISRNTANNYCVGKRCDKEDGVVVPKIALLAAAAIENGISPIEYSEENEVSRIRAMRIIKEEK